MSGNTINMNAVAVTVDFVPMSGFAEGDSVTVEFNEDENELVKGSDGSWVRVQKNRRDGRITMRFLPNARANRILRGRKRLDDNSKGNLPSRIDINDLNTGRRYIANIAWVVKEPSDSFGSSATPLEWVFESPEIEAL